MCARCCGYMSSECRRLGSRIRAYSTRILSCVQCRSSVREISQSWLDLKRRGLTAAPQIAVAKPALAKAGARSGSGRRSAWPRRPLHTNLEASLDCQKRRRCNSPATFFALTEMDKGMRGCRSGSRHSLSDAGTRLGTPRRGETSCSRSITIVRPTSIIANAPSTVPSALSAFQGLPSFYQGASGNTNAPSIMICEKGLSDDPGRGVNRKILALDAVALGAAERINSQPAP